ncbi:unnamed protein product [Leptidea sinapis]|uniref:Uncharacterized protein n=1 Tax=Leptidea sinapis TaxID=189913 RepID=A0A5E4PXR7_9NEOP|nr:unnamed protein product [Leptidea sinapis]
MRFWLFLTATGKQKSYWVMSLLLMIIPFILGHAGAMHCLAVAPTLMLSIMFVVLYIVDQVHDLAEQLYILLQIALNFVALLLVLLQPGVGTIYGLFYCHLIVALLIDQYCIYKERGFSLSGV